MGDFCCGALVGAGIVYLMMPEKGKTTNINITGASPVQEGLEGAVNSAGCQEPGVEEEKNFLIQQIEHYQKSISPRIHELTGAERVCKYEPSCSEYAKQAIRKYGNVKGSLKAAARLARCNPASAGGYDPVK